MTILDFQNLTKPVSTENPCGPDLDLSADSAYLNFLAGAEGRLPSSYFDGKDESGAAGRPFQFSKVELDDVAAAANPLLAKTRDLRLLVLLAKYFVLGRQFGEFLTLIRAIAALLSDRWDEVHPSSEGGEFQARLVAIESINVQPTVIMPLQYLPLIEHRRAGIVSFRGYLIATGANEPRVGDEIIDLATIDKLIREADLQAMIVRRGEFVELQSALSNISETWSAKDSTGGSVQLDKITEVVNKIVAFLDDAVSRRDPSAALVPAKSHGTETVEAAAADEVASVGLVTNPAEASAALTAIAAYFSQHEPSSPALLLVRQAHQLLGKSFLEVMRTLVPAHVEQASINIGPTALFNLPIERLSSFAEGPAIPAPLISDSGDGQPNSSPPAILSRNQALTLLAQVASYYRVAEPSSPIPFLIERARDLAQRDFLSVLQALLPGDSLGKPDKA